MKKFYTVLAAVVLVAAPSAVAGHLLPQTSVTSEVGNAAAMFKVASRADDATTITEWKACPGTWVYVSNYTKKSYPSTVRTRQGIDNSTGLAYMTQYEVTNSLFDKAVITCNKWGGELSMLKENGDYVELLSEDGSKMGKVMVCAPVPSNQLSGNRMQYAPAENVQLLTAVYTSLSNGAYELDYISAYDYFYNSDAPSCAVDVEIPRMATGQLSLSGKVGAGVTDLYYAVGVSNRDQDGAAAYDPDIAARYGFPVNYATMGDIVEAYRANGTTNSAVKMGKISVDANGNFSITIPETWEGQHPVSIFGFKNGEICAQKQNIVEMRSNRGWKAYKNIDIKFSLQLAEFNGNSFPNISVNKQSTMDINEDAKLLRINSPFSDTPSDENYIYLDYSLGMDKCFVADSYMPVTFSATTYDINHKAVTATDYPVFFRSFASCNMQSGYTAADLYGIYKGWFFDLTVETPDITSISQSDAQYYYNGGIYTIGAGGLTLGLTDIANVTVNDDYTITFTSGTEISRIEYSIIDKNNPTISSQTYTINMSGEFGNSVVNLGEAIFNKEIPAGANAVKYAFYNRAGTEVKSGVLPIELNLNVQFANVEYENHSVLTNNSGFRRCSLTTSDDGNPMVTLYDFLKSEYFRGTENLLYITFENGVPVIAPIYNGVLYFDGLGDCDTYVEASNVSRDDNVITGEFSALVYLNGALQGSFDKSNVTITLPGEYNLENGIMTIESGFDGIMSAEYFNLQGQRVASPVKGNLYIERRGTSTRKIVF